MRSLASSMWLVLTITACRPPYVPQPVVAEDPPRPPVVYTRVESPYTVPTRQPDWDPWVVVMDGTDCRDPLIARVQAICTPKGTGYDCPRELFDYNERRFAEISMNHIIEYCHLPRPETPHKECHEIRGPVYHPAYGDGSLQPRPIVVCSGP